MNVNFILINRIYVFFLFLIVAYQQNIFGKEDNIKINEYQQTNILSKLTQISDSQLVDLAKNIIDDSIPGELNYAEILLTEAIRKNPKNTAALITFEELVEKQYINGPEKLKKRFEFVYQAFLIDQNDPKIRYKLANLFYELGQKDLFQSLYENTLTQYPNHMETKIEKIKVLSQTRPDLAIKISENVLDDGGEISDFLTYFLYALQKLDKKNFAQNLRKFAEKYQNKWLWFQLGNEYGNQKNYLEAEYAFHQSIKQGNEIIGGLQIASVQYRNQNKTKEAISNIKNVIHKIKQRKYISDSVLYLAHAQLAYATAKSKNDSALKIELLYLAQHAYKNKEYFITTMNEFIQNNYDNILIPYLKTTIATDPLFSYPYEALEKIYKKQKKSELAKAMRKKIMLLGSTSE